MISYQDLERIDSILPMTLRTLENNLKCLLLENLIHTIPILQYGGIYSLFPNISSSDITPTDLFSLSKRCTLVSYDKDTLLFSQGEEGRRFYMILKGETQVIIRLITLFSLISIDIYLTIINYINFCSIYSYYWCIFW